MRVPRPRFTLRWLMVAVAAVALSLAACLRWDRHTAPGRACRTRTGPSAQVQAGEGAGNQALPEAQTILYPPKPRGTWAGVQEKRIDR